jgi:hypothetical protein
VYCYREHRTYPDVEFSEDAQGRIIHDRGTKHFRSGEPVGQPSRKIPAARRAAAKRRAAARKKAARKSSAKKR